MLEHHYEDIPGWFDYQDVFRNAVDNAKPRDLFVEIGAFLGRSTAFVAVEVANSGNDIDIDVIDTWKGSKDEPYHQHVVKQHGGDMYAAFLDNLSKTGAALLINPKQLDLEVAVDDYEDESIDFCFLDACHRYRDVLRHLELWWPKTKPGGTFAGHDYFWHDGNDGGVERAVHEFFGKEAPERSGSSWVVVK